MPESGATIQSFAYQAQTAQGHALSGTIDAADVDSASRMLATLQLRVTAMGPSPKPPTGRSPLRGADFLAFNQQLSQLTAGGLPVERSLRLLVREMRGRQAAAINAIAEELEKGVPLDAAFAKYASLFPPLYGLLIQAGMKTSDLPAMLLNLNRHVEMIQRLRAAFWRAATYPLAVLTALLVVMAFLWSLVIPEFGQLVVMPGLPFYLGQVQDWSWMFGFASALSLLVMIVVGVILLVTVSILVAGRFARGRRWTEAVVLRLPMVGKILKTNLLARWCDAIYLATKAGLNLPSALTVAGDVAGSRRIMADSRRLRDAVSAGQPMDVEATRLIPLVAQAALQLGAEHNDLPETAAMLSRMYQDQAEIRLSVLPQVLSPIFMIVTAVFIGLALVAVLMPVVAYARALLGVGI